MKEFKVMRKRRRRRASKGNRILALTLMTLCAILVVCTVCVLCFEFLSNDKQNHQTYDTLPCVIENNQTTTLIMESGQTSIMTVSANAKVTNTLQFMSDDTDVLTVDSGGRVDAKKAGQATVTAQGKGFFGECVVTVEKAQKTDALTEYTTAYVANMDIVEQNKKDASQNLYRVTVNRRTNTVTVYTYDENGDYKVPVRAMVCSCGELNEENITPTGTYAVYFKNRWHALFGDVYGQYVTGFSGHYLFHSVPYLETSADSLKTEEFNKLGTNASQGCVRLMVSDAKWIYDNLSMDTEVEVIDENADSDPLGTPPVLKVDTNIKWDPTDPAKKNPYLKQTPKISGAEDVTIAKDSDFDAKVTATDTCSQDITDRIVATGNLITSKVGKYLITYSVTDDLGKTAEKTITITVE